MRQYHKPVRRPSDVLEDLVGSGDPAEVSSAAHDTAAVLVCLVGAKATPVVRQRLNKYIEEEGIDGLLELWSQAAAVSLPGALWRLHQLEQQLPEGRVAADIRDVLTGSYLGDFGNLCERAAVIAGRLGPRWDQRGAELQAAATAWYEDSLW